MDTHKQRFIEFAEGENHLPLFLSPQWLDNLVGPKNWSVAMAGKKDQVKGVLPFFFKRKAGHFYITMPPLIPYMGPWLNYPPDQKTASTYSFEKETLMELINQLPSFAHFIQYFHPALQNWLPFYWNGFSQTTRYTYRIPGTTEPETGYENLQGRTRREIKKAEKQLTIQEAFDPHQFHNFHQKAFSDKKQHLFYSREMLEKITNLCQREEQGKMLWAMDQQEQIHATVFLVWDHQTVYYLVGASSPKFKTSGAMSYLLWNGVQFALKRKKSFDLEGSMIEPVERHFRSFGAIQTPYFAVYKTPSLLFKSYLRFRGRNY